MKQWNWLEWAHKMISHDWRANGESAVKQHMQGGDIAAFVRDRRNEQQQKI